MTNAPTIIARKFGGPVSMAAAVGVSPWTVRAWMRRGYVPSRQQNVVLEAGRTLADPVQPADFFPTLTLDSDNAGGVGK